MIQLCCQCWASCLATQRSAHAHLLCWICTCTGKCCQQGQGHIRADTHSFQLSSQQQRQTLQDCHQSCQILQPKVHGLPYRTVPHDQVLIRYLSASHLSWHACRWLSTHDLISLNSLRSQAASSPISSDPLPSNVHRLLSPHSVQHQY